MNQRETYEAWKDRRKDVDVSAGFADRVMQEIVAAEDCRSDKSRASDQSDRVERKHSWGMSTVAALLLVSLTAGLLRFGSIIALVLLMGSSGY